jgi:hypothetical protein
MRGKRARAREKRRPTTYDASKVTLIIGGVVMDPKGYASDEYLEIPVSITRPPEPAPIAKPIPVRVSCEPSAGGFFETLVFGGDVLVPVERAATELSELVRGMELRLHTGPIVGIVLRVFTKDVAGVGLDLRVPDRAHPATLLDITYTGRRVPKSEWTASGITEAIREAVKECVDHEFREGFTVKGVRALDPHPPAPPPSYGFTLYDMRGDACGCAACASARKLPAAFEGIAEMMKAQEAAVRASMDAIFGPPLSTLVDALRAEDELTKRDALRMRDADAAIAALGRAPTPYDLAHASDPLLGGPNLGLCPPAAPSFTGNANSAEQAAARDAPGSERERRDLELAVRIAGALGPRDDPECFATNGEDFRRFPPQQDDVFVAPDPHAFDSFREYYGALRSRLFLGELSED